MSNYVCFGVWVSLCRYRVCELLVLQLLGVKTDGLSVKSSWAPQSYDTRLTIVYACRKCLLVSALVPLTSCVFCRYVESQYKIGRVAYVKLLKSIGALSQNGSAEAAPKKDAVQHDVTEL